MFATLLAASLFCAQEPDPAVQVPPGVDAALVCGALDSGRLRPGALGLGDGGFDAGPSQRSSPDPARTHGGARLEVRAQGVKLDFPSRGELLVTPDGRLHLRGGEVSEAFSFALHLWLADGSVVRLQRASGDRPLRLVEIADAAGARTLWRDGRAVAEPGGRRELHAPTWLVLGDGRVVYRAAALGPVLVLERVLCPAALHDRFPERRALVVGDVLALSLFRLPTAVPRHATEFREARQVVDALAALTPRLFRRGVVGRADGAIGPLTLPLDGGFSLRIDVRARGPVAIGLFSADRAVPFVEWTIAETTRLHLVEPEGGAGGAPRYAFEGLVLRDLVEPLCPARTSSRDTGRARAMLASLGSSERGS